MTIPQSIYYVKNNTRTQIVIERRIVIIACVCVCVDILAADQITEERVH